MALQDIIAKIAKLRALSQSSNVHEAANAAAAAERLIQEHRISEAELSVSIDPSAEDPVTEEKIPLWNERITNWQADLMNVLVRQYGCSWVTCASVFADGAWRKSAHVFGRASDVALIKSQYAWLALEIIRLCALEGKGMGKSWRTSYCMGAVRGISSALAESNREVRAQHTSNALVKLDERAKIAVSARNAYYPKLGTRQGGVIRDDGAYTKGFSDGRNINQSRSLPSNTTRGLLK